MPGTIIVMATEGHDGLLDYVKGSTTERVLHKLHSPLLSIPMLRGWSRRGSSRRRVSGTSERCALRVRAHLALSSFVRVRA